MLLREEQDEVNTCTCRYSLVSVLLKDRFLFKYMLSLSLPWADSFTLMRKSQNIAERFPKEKILMELLCQSSSATLEATCKRLAIPILQYQGSGRRRERPPGDSVVALWLWTDTFSAG